MSNRPRLGDLLVEARILTREQLEEALAFQRSQGAGGRRLGALLVERGFLTEVQLTRFLSQQLAVPWVSLHYVDFSRQLLNLVPCEIATRYCLVPVYVRHERKTGDTLYLAMDDPTHDEALRAVMAASGLPVRAMIAPPAHIRAAIQAFYAPGSEEGAETPARLEVPPPPPRRPSAERPPPPPVPATRKPSTSPVPPPSQAAAPVVIDPPPEITISDEPEPETAPVEAPVVVATPAPVETAATTPADASAPETAPVDVTTPAPAEVAPVLSDETPPIPAVSAPLIEDEARESTGRPSPPRESEPGPPAPEPEAPRPPSERPKAAARTTRKGPRMIALTLLDGRQIAIPAPRKAAREPDARAGRPPPAEAQLTTNDLIAALGAISHGAKREDVLGDEVRWETLVAALLRLLLKKHVISDWEFVDEWRKV